MKILRRILRIGLVLFLLLNIATAFHAYRFTHFYDGVESNVMKPETMTWSDKFGFILFGMKYPKSKNGLLPAAPYETVVLKTKDGLKLEGWWRQADSAVGTVILFHGHGGSKSSLIPESDYFLTLGYNTLSMDFRAHGGSDGNVCTIGYREGEDVKLACDFVRGRGERNVVLWGISLGAATITRAIAEYEVRPEKIILELSFGSLQDAVKARVRLTSLPEQPIAGLLTFWGGIQQDFWAFNHSPCDYAKQITCPTLVQHAAKDARVSLEESTCILNNLKSSDKKLVIYETALHESLYKKEPEKWKTSVSEFLKH